jgi:3-isopropylmalate/(R)-2-methylmalate dehydratase small subunit
MEVPLMRPFRVETGIVAPLPRNDVDTDQIIPKQFLKRVSRTGFGEVVFHDWRADPQFVLNQPQYREASILVAGKNFGCGSSREHAVWALLDFGFRAIVAASFADIFLANCTNNGLLAIAMQTDELIKRTRLTIDLEACEVRDGDFSASFEMDPFRRERLLNGYDDIEMTLRHDAAIAAYEMRRTHPTMS